MSKSTLDKRDSNLHRRVIRANEVRRLSAQADAVVEDLIRVAGAAEQLAYGTTLHPTVVSTGWKGVTIRAHEFEGPVSTYKAGAA